MVSSRYEERLRQKGNRFIAGIDEAGRGPLAGPVLAAAVMFPPKIRIKGLDDSKKLSREKREELYPKILESATSVGVGIANEKEVDRLNIQNATNIAMHRAVERLSTSPDHILIDGTRKIKTLNLPQTCIKGGDARCSSIAAASIIAKVTRDRIMERLETLYPGYGFSAHKGYGTKRHLKSLKRLGPAPIHRKSFYPVSKYSKHS